MTVSLERYVAVCHPLRARSLCTYGRARIYLVGIVIFSALYNIPRFWEGKVKSEWVGEYNTTIYCPMQSTFRDNEIYQTVYIHWLYLICMYLLPFLSLAILNAAIYRQATLSGKIFNRSLFLSHCAEYRDIDKRYIIDLGCVAQFELSHNFRLAFYLRNEISAAPDKKD
ncbi:hypothetical protein HUJ05_012141 [Dendroctonus ponderosae]|nr:hypothetical protein HUJ05_012141 [Dendroctonus ponderosae]